jgi:hypothetical protein
MKESETDEKGRREEWCESNVIAGGFFSTRRVFRPLYFNHRGIV